MSELASRASGPSSRRTPVIALTGGIASGKTAVSDAFAALGIPVVDTDVIAREVVAPGSVGLEQVRRKFGNEIIATDGSLDRTALRRVIFSDPGARTRLEAILHPLIAQEAGNRLEKLDAPYAILVVPLLVETGLFRDADRVLVVDVPEEMQIQRLIARDGVDRIQAEAALAAQADRQQRLKRANDVIENTSTLEALTREVAKLDRQYRLLARPAGPDPE